MNDDPIVLGGIMAMVVIVVIGAGLFAHAVVDGVTWGWHLWGGLTDAVGDRFATR